MKVDVFKIFFILAVVRKVTCLNPKNGAYAEGQSTPVKYVFFKIKRRKFVQSARPTSYYRAAEMQKRRRKWRIVNLLYSSLSNILMILSINVVGRSMIPMTGFSTDSFFRFKLPEKLELKSILPTIRTEIIPHIFGNQHLIMYVMLE